MSTPEKKYINAIDSTLETWNDLIEFCIHSEFYQSCLSNQYSKKISARITLIWAYLLTFSHYERIKLESDPEYFLKYATAFINELSPFKYNKNGYDKEGRKMFLAKIKFVLISLKKYVEDPKNKDRYIFLEEIVHLFSNIDKFCNAYDLYKNYIFRFRPKLKETYDYQI